MASLLQTRSRDWPLKGLGLTSPDYQVGAHFEALDKGVLMAASKSIETFFAISTFPELRVFGISSLWDNFSFLCNFFIVLENSRVLGNSSILGKKEFL